MSREIKVGVLVLAALVILMVGTFLIGEKSNLFVRKNRYFVRFESVSGLGTGSPVQLNGVNVGDVTEIVLPRDVTKTLLTVWVSVDRNYQGRIRRDSVAAIKTLGLLGDKYIEITSGSAASEVVPSGGQIFAAPKARPGCRAERRYRFGNWRPPRPKASSDCLALRGCHGSRSVRSR